MSFYTVTTQKLVDAVTHVLNKTPDSRRPALDICNEAMQFLCDQAEWTWKQKPLSLAFTANQSYIELPGDFDQLKVLKSAYGTFRDVVEVSLDKLAELRQFAFGSSFEMYYSLSWNIHTGDNDDDNDVDEWMLPSLEIFPTPSADAPSALQGTYLRRIPMMELEDDDGPEIPGQYHHLLLVLCRAMAVSSEESQAGEDWRLFNQMLPTYTDKDGRIGGWSAGKMRATVGRSAYPLVSQFWPNGNITAG